MPAYQGSIVTVVGRNLLATTIPGDVFYSAWIIDPPTYQYHGFATIEVVSAGLSLFWAGKPVYYQGTYLEQKSLGYSWDLCFYARVAGKNITFSAFVPP